MWGWPEGATIRPYLEDAEEAAGEVEEDGFSLGRAEEDDQGAGAATRGSTLYPGKQKRF